MNIYDAAKVIKKIDKVCNKQQKVCNKQQKFLAHLFLYRF